MDQALTLHRSALPAPAAGDLSSYFQQVGSFPLLDVEQERELALRLREEGDLDAARTLVLSNLRFVVHIARGYSGYGLPLADIIQEGNIGLMKAVKRFDPDVGVRLISFAVHWIRAEIHEYVIRNWRIVKVATTKAQRKLFFKLRSSKSRLGWFSHDEVQAVARDLGVEPKVVMEMEARLSSHDTSYDAPIGAEDESGLAPAAYLAHDGGDPSALLESEDYSNRQHERLTAGMSELDDRSRTIIARRWLSDDKSTLQELAGEYGVSAERIRQIENNAMKKLKGYLIA